MAHKSNYLELTIPMETIVNEYMILPTIVKRKIEGITWTQQLQQLLELYKNYVFDASEGSYKLSIKEVKCNGF